MLQSGKYRSNTVNPKCKNVGFFTKMNCFWLMINQNYVIYMDYTFFELFLWIRCDFDLTVSNDVMIWNINLNSGRITEEWLSYLQLLNIISGNVSLPVTKTVKITAIVKDVVAIYFLGEYIIALMLSKIILQRPLHIESELLLLTFFTYYS